MNFKKLTSDDYYKLGNKHTENKNHIILSFYDFEYDPKTITKILELIPTESGVKNEEYKILGTGTIKKRDCNYWELEAETITNQSISEIISNFIDKFISSRVSKIKNISETAKVKLTIVQYYIDGSNPGYYISKENLKILTEINADLEFDIYIITPN